MHESTCSKDYALKPPGLKSDSLIRRRREATPRPRPRPGAGRGEPGSRRKPGGWGSPSWSELDTDIHMVLKKGWPGTLPETSPVTCPWPRDQILHALPEAHPLAMGRWGAAARPGGRKCTHTPRQRIKCSPAGISAPPPPSPQPCCLASSHKNSPADRARQLGSPARGPWPAGLKGPRPQLPVARPACPEHLAHCVHNWVSPAVGLAQGGAGAGAPGRGVWRARSLGWGSPEREQGRAWTGSRPRGCENDG